MPSFIWKKLQNEEREENRQNVVWCHTQLLLCEWWKQINQYERNRLRSLSWEEIKEVYYYFMAVNLSTLNLWGCCWGSLMVPGVSLRKEAVAVLWMVKFSILLRKTSLWKEQMTLINCFFIGLSLKNRRKPLKTLFKLFFTKDSWRFSTIVKKLV